MSFNQTHTFTMRLLLLLVLWCGAVQIQGSGIVFVASPATIQPLLTDEVVLRCSLKDSPSSPGAIIGRSLEALTSRKAATQTTSIEFVTSMVISKDGADVATLTEHIPAKSFSNSTGVTVTGSIARSAGERGFLQVTLRHPDSQAPGEYTCDVTGVDSHGHSADFSQTLEVQDKDITLDDVVHNLYALKKENDDLKQMMATKVFFSVGVTSHLTVPGGQDVIYDKVFSNVGAGYDVTTGRFTAPVAGHYHLEINGLSQADKNFFFELQLNNQPEVVIYGTAGHSHQGSSNSVILKLAKGDVLRVASMNSVGSVIYGTPSLIYSTFTGQLISLV